MSQTHPMTGHNGLRALACLSVVFYHLNQHRSTEHLSEWNWDLYQFTETLPVVVSFFFVLTGISLSAPFWKLIAYNTSAPSAKTIFVNRFFRIAPAYYLALFLTFLLVLLLDGYSSGMFQRLLAGMTFLSWTTPETFFPVDINGPLWFIAYDTMGAAIVLLVMSLLTRIPKKWIGPTLACVAGALLSLHSWFVGLPFSVSGGIVSEWFPRYNPFIFGLHFLVGVLISGALVWMESKKIRSSHIYDLAFLAVAAGLIVFLFWIREAADFSYTLFESPHRFPFATLPIAILLLLSPYTSYLGRYLDNRLFRAIARLSYSIYLYHAIVIVLLLRYAFREESLLIGSWFLLIFLTFAITVPIAWISFRFIEIPVSVWWSKRVAPTYPVER